MTTSGIRGSARVSASHASAEFCNPPERVKRYEYDYKTGQWTTEEVWVRLSSQPFQQGTLRYIYYMLDLSKPEGQQEYVAKLCKNVREPSKCYFEDVMMHGTAKCFAEEFNAANPPKKVDFVLPAVVEFTMRRSLNAMDGHMHMNVEPLMKGTYKKYSNNFGFVSPDERNTPHAFSHFTYHASGGKMLVCDIQGVDDLYTDPQIHSVNSLQRWGKGDMGMQGIMKFFSTHRCSSICEYLHLPRPNKALTKGNQLTFTPSQVAPQFVPKIYKGLRDRQPQAPQLPVPTPALPRVRSLPTPKPAPAAAAVTPRGGASRAIVDERSQVVTRRLSESSDSHPSSGHVSSGSNSIMDSLDHLKDHRLGVAVPFQQCVYTSSAVKSPLGSTSPFHQYAPRCVVPGGYQAKPSVSVPITRPLGPQPKPLPATSKPIAAGGGVPAPAFPFRRGSSLPYGNDSKTPMKVGGVGFASGSTADRAKTPTSSEKIQFVPSKMSVAHAVQSQVTAF